MAHATDYRAKVAGEDQSSETDLFARHTSLTKWVLENGGYFHPDVEIAYSSAAGFHVVVVDAKTILPQTRIASSPMTCTLSVLNALNIEPFSDRGTKFPKAILRNNIKNRELLQAFFLMEQAVLGDESWWAPYVRSLPSVDDVNALQFDVASDEKWIRGTNLETGYKELMTKWRANYQKGLDELRACGWDEAKCNAYTWELYRWAASMFGSRGFSSIVLSDTNPSEQARLGANHGGRIDSRLSEIFSERFAVLLPLLDILNHKSKAKVDWQPRTAYVGLQVRDTYEAGEQIYNNYGPKDNESLLLSYGFVSEDRAAQHVALALRVPPGTLLDLVKKWPLDQRANTENKLYLLNTDHFKTKNASCLESTLFDYSLLDTISVLTANERESQVMMNSRKTLMSTGLAKPHSFDDFRNLLAVLGQLLVHCEKGRARLVTTRPTDDPQGSKQINANILRDQQIEHYSDAILLCRIILGLACHPSTEDVPAIEFAKTLDHDALSTTRINRLILSHRRITRSNELFSLPHLLDMILNGTRTAASQLIDTLSKRIRSSHPELAVHPAQLSQCQISILIAAAQHAYTRGAKITQRLAEWLQTVGSWYPMDGESWAYVPTEGPWSPGEEPPVALSVLLKVSKEYLIELTGATGKDDGPNMDTISQWLKPKALCWAFNVMNEEMVQVPLETVKASHADYALPDNRDEQEDPMDVMLYISSQ